MANEMDARLISQGTQVGSVGAEALIPVASGEGQPQSNITLANLADSLGKAVPKQQDAKQVTMTGLYAQTSDGKMVELTKESVASVMAGLMGTNKLFPFMYKGIVTDANTATTTGIYKCGNSVVNTPVTYGELFVYESDGLYTAQLFVGFNKKEMYYRGRTSSTSDWWNWRRVDNFDCSTKGELASMVAEQITSSNKEAYTLSADVEVETNITKSGLYRWDFRDDNSTRPLYFIFDYSLIAKLNESWFGSKITLRADSGKLFIKYTNAGNVILTFLG